MKQLYFHNKRSVHEHGFTLVETLVAISILLLTVIGPITVAQKGIKSAYYANEEATAVFLAQEAMESVYEIRDSYALSQIKSNGNSKTTADWLDDIDGACKGGVPEESYTNSGCNIDPLDVSNSTPCGSGNGYCRLYVYTGEDPAKPPYTNVTGTDYEASPYHRRVFVNDVNGDGGAAEVTVIVNWNSVSLNNEPREVRLQSWLYDHYKALDN